VTVDEQHDLDELKTRLTGVAEVEVIDRQCIIAIVGRNLLADAMVGAHIFEAMRGVPMQMLSLGRSGLNLSIVIDDAKSDDAIQRIHAALFEQAVAV
jgi:aspartate kinase